MRYSNERRKLKGFPVTVSGRVQTHLQAFEWPDLVYPAIDALTSSLIL